MSMVQEFYYTPRPREDGLVKLIEQYHVAVYIKLDYQHLE